MGILRDVFELLRSLSGMGYIDESEKWFVSVWKGIRNPYCGDGILAEKNGKLYRRFKVVLQDDSIGVFVDDGDYGILVENANLSSYQRHNLRIDGQVIIKHYNG